MSFGKRGLATADAGTAGRVAVAPARSAARTAPTRAPITPGDFAKWGRVPAMLIDNALSFVLPWVCIAVVDAVTGGNLMNGAQALVFASLISLAYFAGFESSEAQATPGKRMMGLVVTDADGARIGLGRALLRNSVGRAVDAFSPAYIGYSCVLFTKEARAGHDFVAGTRVRRADGAPSLTETFA